jgi:DNA sulfur modification protein DndB
MKRKKKTPGPLQLPALHAVMGDRKYFITAMTLAEIATRIKDVKEVHKSERLCDWIQRQLDDKHAKSIYKYLRNETERFFNAIVVGVYGGNPQWSELAVKDPRDELSSNEEDRMNRTVGVLALTGREDLFPIDGQHRVAGIKLAVKEKPDLGDDEVTVIMVGHAKTDIGKARTRRLFVTLNKRARKVSERDIVALDEDNGLAVVARGMIDDFELFQEGELISFSGTVAINETDDIAISSIIGIYQIVKSLYPKEPKSWPKRTTAMRTRPSQETLKEVYEFCCEYWEFLCDAVKEYQKVLRKGDGKCSDYRQPTKNHLLFRPAGQNAFARAVECLIGRGHSMQAAIDLLVEKASLWLHEREWHNILWDPVKKKMLNDLTAAEALLLEFTGEQPRNEEAKERLNRIRQERGF